MPDLHTSWLAATRPYMTAAPVQSGDDPELALHDLSEGSGCEPEHVKSGHDSERDKESALEIGVNVHGSSLEIDRRGEQRQYENQQAKRRHHDDGNGNVHRAVRVAPIAVPSDRVKNRVPASTTCGV